jgi:TonB family protein
VRPGAAPNAAELWAQSMSTGATSEAAKPAPASADAKTAPANVAATSAAANVPVASAPATVEPAPDAARPDAAKAAAATNGASTAGADDAPSPISNLFANQPVRKRPPTPPPVHLESLAKPIIDGDLPQGDFAYPIKRSGAGVLLKIVLALAMLGLGFFAFIKLYPQDDKPTQTAAVTPPPAEPTPPAAPAPAAVVVDAQAAAEPAPADIEIDPAQPAGTTTPSTAPSGTSPTATSSSSTSPSTTSPSSTPTRPGSSSHSSSHSSHTSSTSRPVTTPSDTSADKTSDTKASDAKPAGDKPEPAGDCDEVSCVLAKYDRPCCERYKPAEGFTPKNVVPDELDRSMVKAGVEKIKPKVVACGEQHAAKGTVKIAVTVDPEGNVKAASVSESPDAGLGECVAGAMRNAKFGKSVKGGEFNYPFAF